MRNFLLACALLACAAKSADLLVDLTTPGAYRTLQAALDAAQPGDRILIAQANLNTLGVRTTIRKSVTIQTALSGRIGLMWTLYASAPLPRLVIESLTPGIPLVMRGLEFQAIPEASANSGTLIATSGALNGEIRLEDVWITYASAPAPLEHAITLVNLQVTRLLLRRCKFSAQDTASNGGCQDIPDTRGSSALRFAGNVLVLEDSDLRAGSANFIKKIDCGGMTEYATGGAGGAALVAASSFTFMVRTRLSDGNGGSVQTGNWKVTPSAGPAGESLLSASTGTLAAFLCELEAGKPGAILPSDPGPDRGARIRFGNLEAPLVFSGPAKVGDTATLLLGPSLTTPLGVLLGFGVGPFATSIGNFLFDATQPILGLPLATPGILTLGIPNDPALVGLLVVAQVVENSPVRAGNPATVGIER